MLLIAWAHDEEYISATKNELCSTVSALAVVM